MFVIFKTKMAAIAKKRAAALILLNLLEDEYESPPPRNKKSPTRQWIQRREERGVYHQLVQELALEDPMAYRDFFRMTREQFNFLVEILRPSLEKKQQPFPINLVRNNISAGERLAVTLRFLATGETYHSLEFSFRISRQQISDIICETCQCLYGKLAPEYFKIPNTASEWETIAERFRCRWNFPNGLGALDGKRIIIQQPNNSGSHFYDYKGNNSVILLAVFGPDYECLWANVGANGRSSDATVWGQSDLKAALGTVINPTQLPPPTPLPGRTKAVPYVLTGDDAFSLSSYLMKPFPQAGLTTERRIFNYRLSRMRRISENGFGILANRYVQKMLAIEYNCC